MLPAQISAELQFWDQPNTLGKQLSYIEATTPSQWHASNPAHCAAPHGPLFIYQRVQARARVQRQAPKRVSIKVDEARIRDGEALAEGSQLIGTIQGCGAGGGKVHGQDGNCGERGASSRHIGSPCMRRTVRVCF